MSLDGVGYTPRKMIKPLSYNGVSSTGFKGVQVFQSDTTINRTIVIDSDCCNSSSSSKGKSSFWSKLAGVITGVGLGAGLIGMIGKVLGSKNKGKSDGKGTVENDDISTRLANEQAQLKTTQGDESTVKGSDGQTSQQAGKTLYGGQLSEVLVRGDASKAKKPRRSMSADMKQDVAEEAKDLKGYYSGIIKDIQVEKQSDGTYKIRIVVPDTLKYNGDTAALNGTVKNSEELNALLDNALGQLLTPQHKENPFAKQQET